MIGFQTLVEQWSREAALYESDGLPHAKVLQRCARQLSECMSSAPLQTISVAEAARRSGYSEDHLYRLVKQGSLQNYGTSRHIKLMIAELPRKSGARPQLGGFRDYGAASMVGLPDRVAK